MIDGRIASFIGLALVVGCNGSNGGSADDAPADDAPSADASDQRPMDPADPVEVVPAHGGIYKIGMLSSDEDINFGQYGTWFTNPTSEHEVLGANIVRYSRYRDRIVMQDLSAPRIWIYDTTTTMPSAPIDLPSDAAGVATIRGGFVYVGGLARVYSYEIATSQWRMRPLSGTGTCHHVAAGATRLFVMCSGPTVPNDRQVFSTWANKTMSDVVPLGSISRSQPDLSWISASPAADVAYFESSDPSEGCIGTMTATTLEPCSIPLRNLPQLGDVFVVEARPSEDGGVLFVSLLHAMGTRQVHAIDLATKTARYVTSDVRAFATCPDGAAFIMRSGPERYAGGVTTDLRLANGGQRYIECALQPM